MPAGSQNIALTVTGKGELEISDLRVYASSDILIREFMHGTVVVNPSRTERIVKWTGSDGTVRKAEVAAIDASFIKSESSDRRNSCTEIQSMGYVETGRPAPLRNLDTQKTISVRSFGAVSDDGQNDWEAITLAISEICRMSKEGVPFKLEFPKGTYNIMPESGGGQTHCFTVSNLQNVVFEGNGSDIIVDNPQYGFMAFKGCENIIVRGFNVDYSIKPYTQGTIIEKSVENRTIDYKIDDGYPQLDARHFVESKTRWGSAITSDCKMLKEDYPNLIPFNDSKKLSDGLFRVKTGNNVMDFLDKGDRVAFIARYNGRPTYSVSESFQISFINNINYAGPAGGFASRGSMINVMDCSVLKKPGRLISQNADCMHVLPFKYGPWIEGNVFSGQMDDAINIKTELIRINSRFSANSFLVSGSPKVGDNLRLYNPREGIMLGWYRIVAVEEDKDRMVKIMLDREVEADVICGSDKTSDMFFNDDKSNRGFVIKNNEFSNSRRYAMLIQATYGIISGNVMENTSTGGVVLQNGATWPEGFVPRNITVFGNRLINCGFDNTFQKSGKNFGAIVLKTAVGNSKDGIAQWRGVENILIENNLIVSSSGSPAIYMGGVKNSVLKNNVFNTSCTEPVTMENCEDIIIL